MTKISPNIMKVSMYSYLPNAPINLRLNFTLEQLVKRETPFCDFAKVGVKGGENILECLKILHARLLIKLASKFMIKFQILRNCSKGKLRLAVSTALGLKAVKIA